VQLLGACLRPDDPHPAQGHLLHRRFDVDRHRFDRLDHLEALLHPAEYRVLVVYTSTVEYADSVCVLGSSMANTAGNTHMEPVVYGHKGTITFDGDAVVVDPEWQYLEEFVKRSGSSKMYFEVEPHDMNQAHIDNFLDCMRSRQQPNCDADFGYKIMTAIKLGVDSYREGKTMLWDPVSERRIDQPLARKVYEGDGLNHEEPRRGFRR
jgi:hypothetical protein